MFLACDCNCNLQFLWFLSLSQSTYESKKGMMMNILRPSAAGAISSTPDIFLIASCSASPNPGTILKAPGIPWGPPGGGGGAGAMPPPGGGGGGGGGMIRCLYSGGMVELAGDPRHSSDCCPERHHARPGTWQGANVRHAPRQGVKSLFHAKIFG